MHLFHSWRPIFPTACHLFWSSLSPPSLWQTLVLRISMSDTAFCLLVYSFVLSFRFHIHEWNQRVFLLGKFKRYFLKVWRIKSKPGSGTWTKLSFLCLEEKHCGTELSRLFYRGKKKLRLILYKFQCGYKVWEDQREFRLVRETNKNKRMQ